MQRHLLYWHYSFNHISVFSHQVVSSVRARTMSVTYS